MIDIYAGKIETFCTLQKYFKYKMPHWFLDINEIKKIFKSNYELINSSYAHTLRLNKLGEINMDNFQKKYRLKNSINLLYKQK